MQVNESLSFTDVDVGAGVSAVLMDRLVLMVMLCNAASCTVM